MHFNLIYFSQTGNTRRVAKKIYEILKSEGQQAKLISYKKANDNDFIEADVIGVGAPCFESQAPSIVRDFLWGLPQLDQKKVFVFATSGGAPGKVLYDLSKPLMKKGAKVIGGLLCRGTCYYPVPCLVGRFPNRPNEVDLEKVNEFANNLLSHIISGIPGPMPSSRDDTFKLGFGLYQIAGAILNDSLLRFLMPEPKLIDSKCTECKWCEEECPTNSIKLNPMPEIGKTCFRCYRCLTGCPEEAFSVQWGISNFIVWTLYNQTFERWLGDVQKGERIY